MTIPLPACAIALAAALVLSAVAPATFAQAAPTKKKAPARAAKKTPAKVAAEPAPPAAAGPEQIDAAERVYYGIYDCEFKQSVNIVASPKFPSYVDVKHAKAEYLMKPVLSSTGAIRLEDVRGEMLMVQVASKSMLLNVKSGQRVVDECISPKQRELMEAAKAKAAAATAAAAQSPAQAPVPAALAAPAAPAASAASAAEATPSASESASAPTMTTAPAPMQSQ